MEKLWIRAEAKSEKERNGKRLRKMLCLTALWNMASLHHVGHGEMSWA